MFKELLRASGKEITKKKKIKRKINASSWQFFSLLLVMCVLCFLMRFICSTKMNDNVEASGCNFFSKTWKQKLLFHAILRTVLKNGNPRIWILMLFGKYESMLYCYYSYKYTQGCQLVTIFIINVIFFRSPILECGFFPLKSKQNVI